MEYRINEYEMKALVPVEFYNLNSNTFETYLLNIASDYNFLQRFDLDNPELPDIVFQTYADVYDGDKEVLDDILFISYNGETDFITAIRAINKVITPEIYKYREFTHKAFIYTLYTKRLVNPFLIIFSFPGLTYTCKCGII